jgi:thioredoxin reductase
MKGNDCLHPVTGVRVTDIKPGHVTAVDKDGREQAYGADTVVLSVGMKSDEEQTDALCGLVPRVYVIGDGKKARKIMQAVAEGYDAAVDIGL